MMIAIMVFMHGVHYYKIHDYCDYRFKSHKTLIAIVLLIALWLTCFFILNYPAIAKTVFCLVVLLCIVYFIRTLRKESAQQAKQTMVIGLLCIISVFFWAFYFQMFLSLTLFIVRMVQSSFLGISFPPPYYVCAQSMGMIILGIMLARRKPEELTRKQHAIRTGNKFVLSMISMTIAYAIIAIICRHPLAPGLLSPLYLIPAYLVISLAELLLSPVGLSAVTVLAGRKKVSTMMGIFFVSLGLGAFLSGKLATLTAISITNVSLISLKMHYAESFAYLFYILLGLTFLCILINFLIKYIMRTQPD